MKVLITTIKNMVMESTPGPMVNLTMVNGKMVNSMDTPYLQAQQANLEKVTGKMEIV